MPVRLGRKPAPEAIVTTRPEPARFKCGAAAWTRKKAESTLASNRARQSASDTSSIGRPTCPRDAARRERQDVEPALGRDHPPHEVGAGGPVGEIQHVGRDAERAGGAPEAVGVAIGEVHARAGARRKPARDGAADALRRAGDDHDAGVEAEGHAAMRAASVSGRAVAGRPRRRGSVRPVGRGRASGTPRARPSSATMPTCASTSVRRRRTARSRWMPEWVLAVRLV